MGRMTMQDAIKSVLPEDISLADVDDAFDGMDSLRYAQATQLAGRLQGIGITAFNAGHSLGGTIWRLTRGADRIVYADAWNHARDASLNGAALFTQGQVPEQLARPSVLITDAYNAAASNPPTRVKRLEAFFESIMATLASNGQVLIPIDSATRSLELCELLEAHWRATTPPIPFPVYFVSPTASKVVSYARSMLEWMNDKMVHDYGSSGGLFEFQHVKLITSASALEQLPPGPKVILATSADLEHGFAQSLLTQSIAADPANLIVLSQASSYRAGTLASTLKDQWNKETAASATEGNVAQYIGLSLTTEIVVRTLEPLTGDELVAHNEREQQRREDELARTTIQEHNRNILDGSDDESDDEDEQAVAAASAAHQALAATGSTRGVTATSTALGATVLLTGSTFDVQCTADPLFYRLPGRLKMFPFVERRRRFDDYGEILRPDEFKRADQEEAEAAEAREAHKSRDRDVAAGTKRRWGEINDGDRNDQDAQDDRSVPSKLVTTTSQLNLRCRLRYIDLEGIHDGRSLKNIVESVNPRKLVIARGLDSDREDLRQSCAAVKGFTPTIIVPTTGESNAISLDTNSFEVELADSLVADLVWQNLLNEQVAHVSGKLVQRSKKEEDLDMGGPKFKIEPDVMDTENENESESKIELKDEDMQEDVKEDNAVPAAGALVKQEELLPMVEALSAEEAAQLGRRTTSLFVGNIRLGDLKRTLQQQGHTAELRGGGVLYCDNAVAVTKHADGQILLETHNQRSESFWKIRNVIYGSLASIEL
ncbi:hypothetical protein PYCC9005_000070 [Savitreella phatthalungensis]